MPLRAQVKLILVAGEVAGGHDQPGHMDTAGRRLQPRISPGNLNGDIHAFVVGELFDL